MTTIGISKSNQTLFTHSHPSSTYRWIEYYFDSLVASNRVDAVSAEVWAAILLACPIDASEQFIRFHNYYSHLIMQLLVAYVIIMQLNNGPNHIMIII